MLAAVGARKQSNASAQRQHNFNTAAPRPPSVGPRRPWPHANYNAVKYSYHAANSSGWNTRTAACVYIFNFIHHRNDRRNVKKTFTRRSAGSWHLTRTFFPQTFVMVYYTLRVRIRFGSRLLLGIGLLGSFYVIVVASSGVASYGALGHVPPSTSNNFIFSSL